MLWEIELSTQITAPLEIKTWYIIVSQKDIQNAPQKDILSKIYMKIYFISNEIEPKNFSVIQKAMANKSVSINSKCKLTEIKIISARMGMELAQQNVVY